MSNDTRVWLAARFDSAEALMAAVKEVRAAGHRHLSAHAPFPVPGLAESLGHRGGRIPVVALAVGLLAALAAYLMQWWGAVDYPYVVGGKPLHSWPAFMPITFEMGVLGAVLAALFGMLAANRLPKPWHPLFDWPEFERASQDGFFLCLVTEEPQAARELLRSCRPRAMEDLA